MCIDTYVGAIKPTLKSLMKYRDKIAPHWRHLGIQLLQENYTDKLEVIQADHSNKVEVCCDKMFQHWLAVDNDANWNKLIDALEFIHQNALAANIREDISIGIFYLLYVPILLKCEVIIMYCYT